jgi:hypothetical protein
MTKADTPAEKTGYSGKIPEAALIALEHELVSLIHGTATLTFHIRDGRLTRFTAGRECSFVEDGNGD